MDVNRMPLYRAKGIEETDKNRWYEGYYIRLDDTTYCFEEDYERAASEGRDPRHHYIVFDKMTDWCLPNRHLKADINPETLCMCSWKMDEERKLIYQNDILENPNGVRMVVRFGTYEAYCPADDAYMENVGFYVETPGLPHMPLGPTEEYGRIIGNTIDNPELWKEVEKGD